MDMDALWLQSSTREDSLVRIEQKQVEPQQEHIIRLRPDFNFVGMDITDVEGDEEWAFVFQKNPSFVKALGLDTTGVTPPRGFYLATGVMRFRRGNKALRELTEEAFSHYDPTCYNCLGPRAFTIYFRGHPERLSLGKGGDDGVLPLPKHVLYPVDWQNAPSLLEPHPDAWSLLKTWQSRGTWNIHLFGHATGQLHIRKGSVVDTLAHHFSLKPW